MNQLITINTEAKAISKDMRQLYDAFRTGQISRESAETLVNIAGKNLKAITIMLADELRLSELKTIES